MIHIATKGYQDLKFLKLRCQQIKQNVSQTVRFTQEEEDAHVIITPVLNTQRSGGLQQSSFVSSDFRHKLLNLDNPSPADNEIASLMVTIAHHATVIPEITSSFTITDPPPPPFFNPLSQQATPTLTPTASELQHHFLTLLEFRLLY
ncbi:hypothetical protein Tco_1264240 [Tanacetum coccineum]